MTSHISAAAAERAREHERDHYTNDPEYRERQREGMRRYHQSAEGMVTRLRRTTRQREERIQEKLARGFL